MAQRSAWLEDDLAQEKGIFRRLRPLLAGLFAAILLGLTLLAAVFLAMQEQKLVALATSSATTSVTATDTASPTATATQPRPTPSPRRIEPSPALSPTPSAVARAVSSKASPAARALSSKPTSVPKKKTPRPTVRSQTRCVPPSAWRLYTVQWGDTLSALAWRYWTNVNSIVRANCLSSHAVYAGQSIYLPDVLPRQWCGRPSGWVAYLIQRGDTLFSIAMRVGTTVSALQQANCLTSDKILAGASLWVPHLPWGSPYGSGIAVPSELTGESPIPESSSQARVLSVISTILLVALLATIKTGAVMKRMRLLPRRSHQYATNEQPEVG
jgi:LysM repeat protein